MASEELTSEALYHRCDPQQFTFQSTDELETLTEMVGQPRAVEAVSFGVDIPREGYNIFAYGPPGAGKRTMVRRFLEQRAPSEATPDDWCYVNNFDQPHQPVALRLPAGRGRELRHAMDRLSEDVRRTLRAAFESDEYRHERQAIEQRASEQQQQTFETLRQRAQEKGLAVVNTPMGLAFVPRHEDGKPMRPEEIEKLADEQREQMQAKARELQEQAEELFAGGPRAQRQTQRQIQQLNQRVAEQAIAPMVRELGQRYQDVPAVQGYLDAVKQDMVERAEDLLRIDAADHEETGPQAQRSQQRQSNQQSSDESTPAAAMPTAAAGSPLLRRYRVNVLVEHEPDDGAPVIYEDNPTYQNLVGRIEHLPQMGALITDFNLIKPGALHRAAGGYLVLEAHRVLMHPQAWEGLKRALRGDCIRIEALGEAMGMISTVQLEPEPIELNVKVVLLGAPMLYYMLREMDPDFAELFKVPADFDDRLTRGREEQQLYARLLATLAKKDGLRPLDRAAVARIIEHSARLAGDAQKLSMQIRPIADLLSEADYWARRNGNGRVTVKDVQHAIDAQVRRSDRGRERIQESIDRGMLLIDTTGAAIGQVNGLAVVSSGEQQFGKPTRITARVRLGKGELIDIEREVALGGPLHSKGMLILAGLLSGRYAPDVPLSLAASIVFEQSYSGVDGDSASLAELFSLLSAIAEVPFKQSLAVTGSLSQHGQAQAIGGVNEKIEGFFDTCQAAGLTGEQGVIIPVANVQHLMLRSDVVEAVEAGTFHIWPIDTADEGLELFSGQPAGARDAQGRYPEDSINGCVQRRLLAFADQRRRFGNAVD